MYSKNANNMSMDAVSKINRCAAKIDFIDIKYLGKNALDFQLCALLGTQIGKFRGKTLEIYIVSNDTGYDSMKHGVFEMFKNTFLKKGQTLSIRRIPNCAEIIDAEEKKEKTVEIIKKTKTEEEREKWKTIIDNLLKGTHYEKNAPTIVDILLQKKNTIPINFHNECCKAFGSEDGREIYLLLKPSL